MFVITVTQGLGLAAGVDRGPVAVTHAVAAVVAAGAEARVIAKVVVRAVARVEVHQHHVPGLVLKAEV